MCHFSNHVKYQQHHFQKFGEQKLFLYNMILSKKILVSRPFAPYLSKRMTDFGRNMGSTLTVTQ